MWKAEIVYDADGVQMLTIRGHRISSSVLANGDGTCRALVVVRDTDGVQTGVFHYSRIYSITKHLDV